MIYPWTAVQEAAGNGLGLQIYLANPLATATLLFQRAFWWPSDRTGSRRRTGLRSSPTADTLSPTT